MLGCRRSAATEVVWLGPFPAHGSVERRRTPRARRNGVRGPHPPRRRRPRAAAPARSKNRICRPQIPMMAIFLKVTKITRLRTDSTLKVHINRLSFLMFLRRPAVPQPTQEPCARCGRGGYGWESRLGRCRASPSCRGPACRAAHSLRGSGTVSRFARRCGWLATASPATSQKPNKHEKALTQGGFYVFDN